jgi:hypothetical protein
MKLRLGKSTVFTLVLFMLISFLPRDNQATAQDAAGSFTGIDILLLIDQSGSMRGRGDRVATDPLGLRFQSTQFVMEWLGDFTHHAQPDSTIRMAVVGFGDPQRTLTLDWTILSPEGATTAQWNIQKADLYGLLSEAQFGDRDFVYTNFELAFQQARDLFDRLPALPDDEHNLRVVFVITDGEPCAQADIDTTGSCSNTELNRDQLRAIQSTTQVAFPDSSYRVYFLGIESPDEQFWQEYSPDWQAILREPNTPPRYAIVSNIDDMTREVLAMMYELSQLVSRTYVNFQCNLDANGNCVAQIPPYAQLVSFYVFKSGVNQPTQSIMITKPDGVNLVGGDTGVTVSDDRANIEVWTVTQPAPGAWTIHVDNPDVNRVEVNINQAFIQSDLIHRTNNPAYYQWQSVPIAPYLFFQGDTGGRVGVPDAMLDQYPIDVIAYMTTPNGNQLQFSVPINTEFTGVSPRPHFHMDFVPQDDGEYTIALVGTVPNVPNPDPNAGGAPFTPLDTRTAAGQRQITVKPVAVTIEPDPLLGQRGGEWLQTEPLPLCVIIKDTMNGTLVPNLNQLMVQAVFVGNNGQEQTASLDYQGDTPAQCNFWGTIAPNTVGSQTLSVRGFIPNQQAGDTVLAFEEIIQPVEVQPIQYIRLDIVEPETDEARSNTVSPNPFWNPEPMVVRVAARDQDNNPVNIAALTANQPDEPIEVAVYQPGANDTLEDVTGQNKLVRISDDLYELRTGDFGLGSYQIVLTGNPLPTRACRCAYVDAANNNGVMGSTAQRIVDRVIPFGVWLWLGGALLAVVLVGLAVAYIIWRMYQTRKDPLDGMLYFSRIYYDEMRQMDVLEDIGIVNLQPYRRNEIRFSARVVNAVLDLPFTQVEVTNYGDPKARQQGTARVRFRMRVGGYKTVMVYPGDTPYRFYSDGSVSYEVLKDPDK